MQFSKRGWKKIHQCLNLLGIDKMANLPYDTTKEGGLCGKNLRTLR